MEHSRENSGSSHLCTAPKTKVLLNFYEPFLPHSLHPFLDPTCAADLKCLSIQVCTTFGPEPLRCLYPGQSCYNHFIPTHH